MLFPRKLKHRKVMRQKVKGAASQGTELVFGRYGLKVLEGGWLSARQLEAARRAATRFIKREGRVWTRVFPDKPVTKQPAESGMGGGKGSLDHFVARVRRGRIIFEMDGVPETVAVAAIRLAGHKIPMKTRFVHRRL